MNTFTTSLGIKGACKTEKNFFRKTFSKLGLLTIIAMIAFLGNATAQLTGIKTIPGTYASISAAITDLNAVGVGAGGVTFNIAAGYTETLSARQEITATGTLANPIIFQKSGGGANPLVTSYVGTIATPSTIADGFFVLAGSDYVTFDGIDLMESAANINATTVMEFGYGLFKASATDGCQNNTIKNCVITLNRDQNTAWTAPGHNGSTGIAVLNGLYNATGVVTVTAASGSSSSNKFYANTIQNCNAGFSFIGYADVTPFALADTNNDLGGTSALTGNSILNFGGGAGASQPATGIFANNQWGFNCSYNIINNNNGAGVNHITTLRGIFLNSSSASASVDCNFNTITINGGSTTSQISCIESAFGSTAAGNTVNINNNTIQNCTWTTATTGTWYGIWNNAASPTNLNINNNTFTNNQTNGTSTNYIIYNSGSVAGQININNNNLSRAFLGATANSGTLYSIYNSGGSTSTKLNINGNTFSNYTHATTCTGTIYFIYNTISFLRNSISNNTWNNLSMNHSGSEYLIYNSTSTQSDTLFIQNNSIQTAYTRTAAAGTMYCYYSGASSLGTNTQIFSGNNFSNITASTAGTGTFYGIYNSDGVSSPYPKKFIYNNTISNNIYNSTGTCYGYYMNYLGDGSTLGGTQIYNNTLSGFTWGGTMYGMYISSTVSPSVKPNVFNNKVFDLTSTSTTTSLYATYLLGGGAGLNFYKNKIYNIVSNNTSTSALTCGTYFSSALATDYFNNYIGDIKAPTSANPTNAVNGVYISSGTVINMYFNTIYLSGTSSGANFGGNALYASTTPTLTLKNNIFDNLLVPKGTGVATAYRRSSSTLTTYANASNNNAFYAGTPGAANLIYTDGTTPQQNIAGYKTAVNPRDGASVTENVNFLSTTGANANYLHINAAIQTQLESNATNIAGITDDYDADVRQGNPGYLGSGSAPDIGADEGNFIPLDISGPGIIYTALAGSCGTGDFLLNGVVITDVTGIPIAGSYVPRVYFKKNAGAYFSSPGTLVSGNTNNSTWNFTISAATMGGLIVGDVVSYYVIAQDNVVPINISSNPGGVIATDVLTVTTPPAAPNMATILSSLSGTYTVGVAGDYPTLTAAISAYNTNCVNGPVVFSLIDATYPSETFPISINQVIGQSAINNLTIKPAAGNSATISGSSTSCLINFNGADYVTLDGSNSGGTDRSLILENTATVASRAVVCVTSLGTGLGATNDVIKNCVIKGGSNTVANFGVYVAGATISTTGTGDDNDKLTIQNNDISTVQYGIYARASSVAGENDSLSIIQNSIGSATAANYVTLRGIDMTYNNEALVSQNSISNMITTTLTSCTAIECGAGIQNASITRNNISGIYNDNAGQWAAYGINFNTSTSVTNNLIANNFISDMRTVNYSGSTTYGAYGIRLTGGTNFTIVNNSVHFFGVVTIATGSTCYSSPLLITSAAVTGTILKNNIFFNEQSFLNSATSLAYSLYVPSGYVFAQINNNDYFGASIAPTTYYVGYNGTNRATLADWQTAYPADNMSLSIDPLFTSNTDLHIVSNTCLNQGGMPIANVTDDYDGQLRSTTLPDIGADEFTGTDVTFAFTETSGVANNDGIICSGATVSFTTTNGSTYLWSTGATTPGISVNPIITTTYSVTVTLAAGCSREFSQTITVNPTPVVNITPANPAICVGESVTLTASSAGPYLWSTGETTASIIVTPGANTAYSVTVTSAGCTASASATVVVNPLPIPLITPVSATICAGSSATLTASGGTGYLWSTGETTPGISVSPITNTNYSVTVSDVSGCSATTSSLVTVLPNSTLSSTQVEPSTCVSLDGSITLTVTGGVGPFSFNWSTPDGNGLVNGNQNQSGLSVGSYFVTVTGTNGCTSTWVAALNGPGNCSLCPTITTLTKSEISSCKQGVFTLTASGLTNMGNTYGIIFKSYPSVVADPYTAAGGTVIGTVANGALTGAGTVATLNSANIPNAGSYVLYAILTPTPTSPVCRPSATNTMLIENCEPTITDPCACKNNATTLTNGQFDEAITVNAPAGQNWSVSAVTGLYLTSSPAPPAAPVIIPIGFLLTPSAPLPDGSVNYVLLGVHVDAIGYSVTVTNDIDGDQSIGSTCYYPNPQINGLNATYCANDANVTLAGSATLGGPPGGAATGVGTFTVNGTPNTIFSPSTLGAGTHTVVYSFDAADGDPNASHPGCTQSITQSVLVNPIPTVNAVPNVAYCAGVTVPASNFTGTPVGVTYNWTRTAGAIGLAPLNGVGNVPSFTATNAGATPISSTFTVTPTFTAGGVTCTGSPISYTITINPAPSVTNPGNKIFCSGVATGGITFTGTATSYNWTNTNILIGLAASGTASPTIPSWIPVNNTALPIVGTITVTPVYTNGGTTCTGTAITFTITISPAPKAVCKNFTLYLDAAGLATLLPSNIDGGSTGGTLSVSQSAFTCGNIGNTNITLTVTDACGGNSTCVAIVTVVDNIPPTLVCPGNQDFVLDPGLCDKSVFFAAPYATDNCEIAITTGMITSTYSSNNEFAGNMFNITNTTTGPITINSFDGNVNTAAGTPVSFQVFYTTTAATYVGNTANPAAWTLLGSVTTVAAGINNPTPVPIGGLVLQPGQTKGIYFVLSSYGTGPSLRYTNNNNVYANGELTITTGIGKGNPNFTGTDFLGRSWNGTIHYAKTIGAPPVITQIDNTGYKNGSLFPIGTTCLMYKATDFAGNTSTCQVCVKIEEYPNPTTVMTCNDQVQISLNSACEAIIGADELLNGGPYKCYNDYLVELFKNNNLIVGSPKVTSAQIGDVITAKVTDPATGNSCWSLITVEDKLPPVLNCIDNVISCEDPILPGTLINGNQNFESPVTPIADNATTTIAINVSGAPNPANVQNLDLNVLLDVQHSWIGDIDATLISPSGATVKLFDRPGVPATALGCANDNIYALFDDQAVLTATDFENTCNASTGTSTYAIKGTYKSIDALVNLTNTTNLNGTWQLIIKDNVGGDAGALIRGSLQFSYQATLYNPNPSTIDNCDKNVNLKYTDVVTKQDCTSPYTSTIARTWVATDKYGNKAQCTQNILILKKQLADLKYPSNYDDIDLPSLSCTDAYPTPAVTGTIPVSCSNINCSYTDLVIPVCQNSYKVIRTWTCLDWCNGVIDKHDQVIKVLDKVAPSIICPKPSDVSIEYYNVGSQYQSCDVHVSLPWVPVSDNCSTFNNISMQVVTTDPKGILHSVKDPGADKNFEFDLIPGNYVFTYQATDNCGNLGTCSVSVQIKDQEIPVAVCESYHQVSLTDSVTVVDAIAFDDGSYDKCSALTFSARRLDNPKCQGNDATPFGPTVPFYCCDAKGGQDVTVELRVTDADGNFNTCWSTVHVEDKIRPTMTCPPDITVWCGLPYTPSNIDTTVVHNDVNSAISEVYAHKYQFPLTVQGFPKGSTINDLDVSLNMTHSYTNQLEVTLFDPYGNKATLFTDNSCPGSYGIDINATFNDQAFDIATWNATYNSTTKSGVKSPANYTCISSKIPSIGAYNKGTVLGTGETFDIGQMRPQADHLKVFNGYPLNNVTSKAFADVQDYEIDPTTNRMSSFSINTLINALGLTTGQKVTLKYESVKNGAAINAMSVGTYYTFKIVDLSTLELLAENGTDITSVATGTTHKFVWASTWVLQVYDKEPLAGGYVNSVDLHFAWGLPTALKPVVSDNTEACGIMTTWSDLDQPDPCYNNVIRRRWVATDMFTNSRACIQRVSFEDETPLVVQFPCDATINCDNDQFNINDYVAEHKPIHSGDCEAVGIESIIHEITVVPDACKKYIVKWKVIDWCSYDINSTTYTATGIPVSYADVQEWFPNLPWHNTCDYIIPNAPYNVLAWEDDGDGYFEYSQYIKVLDKIKPVLPCKDTLICSYGACNEIVTLAAKATDICTDSAFIKYSYKVDLFNDGKIEVNSPANTNSPIFTGTVPFGKHRITWTATDGCGNYTTCSYIFWVKDCKKPTPVCINGLSAPNMPVQKVVTIWATDWESGSSYDNCCAHADLVHRVIKTKDSDHQTPPTSTSVTFDCTELGSQAVEVWIGDCGYDANADGKISDDERNWDFCNSFILISDNDGVCGNPMANLTGIIKTETGAPVNGVDLTLLGTSQTGLTGIDGSYTFVAPIGGNYTVVPIKNVNFLNGVNTLDIVYMTNHILGKKALDSGYKKIAADINKDKKITTGDLVQLRQLILHITNEFPNNTSWRFVDGDYQFTTNNQMGENFPETAVENKLTGNVIHNFIAVKIGDVTNSANPNSLNGNSNENRSGASLNFATAEQDLLAGQSYKVDITAADFRDIAGYQFTMQYNVDMLEFVSVDGKILDISAENFGLTNLTTGRITTSWNGKSLTTLGDKEVLFTLNFKALKSGKLSKGLFVNSSLTEAIAFNNNDEAMNVNLGFTNGDIVSNSFALLQNQPNPFKEYTVISFVLPEASHASLKIYDVAGKVLKLVTGDYNKGMNNVRIDRADLPATGMLYYQLDTDTDSAVKKMIIVE